MPTNNPTVADQMAAALSSGWSQFDVAISPTASPAALPDPASSLQLLPLDQYDPDVADALRLLERLNQEDDAQTAQTSDPTVQTIQTAQTASPSTEADTEWRMFRSNHKSTPASRRAARLAPEHQSPAAVAQRERQCRSCMKPWEHEITLAKMRNYGVDEKTNCHMWGALRQRTAYGSVYFSDRSAVCRCLLRDRELAHDVAWMIAARQAIPTCMDLCGNEKIMTVTHSCGNKSCINPDHLFVTTRQYIMWRERQITVHGPDARQSLTEFITWRDPD